MSPDLPRAAAALRDATALVITAGAGMGVDSGLPDFRGTEGFWRAYPAFRQLNLRFEQLANPAWFHRDPHLAWGFYGHRLNLYRDTQPHAGFAILRRWFDRRAADGFVFTSNVDGQFQKAGFPDDRIVECHGSIHHLQCTRPCTDDIWPAAGTQVSVDPTSLRARDPLPTCPHCGAVARPNILMFGDGAWEPRRTRDQTQRFSGTVERLEAWREVSPSIAIVELGAGTAVPTVRLTSERLANQLDAKLIRINVREPQVPSGHVGLPLGARDALVQLDALLA